MNKSMEKISIAKALEILKIDREIKELIKTKRLLGKQWKQFLKDNEIKFFDNVEFEALDIIGVKIEDIVGEENE